MPTGNTIEIGITCRENMLSGRFGKNVAATAKLQRRFKKTLSLSLSVQIRSLWVIPNEKENKKFPTFQQGKNVGW